jgi:hypothetical protein
LKNIGFILLNQFWRGSVAVANFFEILKETQAIFGPGTVRDKNLAEGAHPDGNSPGEKQRGYITPRLNAA